MPSPTKYVLAVTAALVAAAFVPAQGAGDATAGLAAGGTARGDISLTAGETDTIGVELYRGSRVNIKWTADFKGSVRLFGPDAAEIAVGIPESRSATVSGWTAPDSGHYEFKVAAADGSQGLYTLSVKPFWDKTVVVDGAGQQSVDVPMPAASRIRGSVKSLPGASNPSILSLTSPSGAELLVAPIVGNAAIAKLKFTQCADAGTYRLTAQAAAGTQQFRATLKRSVRKIPLVAADARNGLTPISYADDGVKTYFDRNCASCHSWARSWSGVRAYAKSALPRMVSGNMPKGGPRASAETVSLLKMWIATGYAK